MKKLGFLHRSGLKLNKHLILLAIIAFAAFLYNPSPGYATAYLGSAQSFAVLGYAGVTNAHIDPNPQTQIYGNVGVDPLAFTSITGFPPGTVTGGTITGPGGTALSARTDANTAYTTLAGLTGGTTLSATLTGTNTLSAGVYNFTGGAASLGGTLTLDFNHTTNADFVFQIGSTLTTDSGFSLRSN